MHADSHSMCGGGPADIEVLRACVLGPDGLPAAGEPTPCGLPNANETGGNGCRTCGPSNGLTCHSATLAQQIDYLGTLRSAAAGTPLADKLQTAIDRADEAAAFLAASERQKAAGSMASAVAQFQGIVDKGFMFSGRGATLMDDLAGFARQLAVTAINDAELRGGDPAAIAGARTKLAEGDGLRNNASFKDATSKYKDAIGKADGA